MHIKSNVMPSRMQLRACVCQNGSKLRNTNALGYRFTLLPKPCGRAADPAALKRSIASATADFAGAAGPGGGGGDAGPETQVAGLGPAVAALAGALAPRRCSTPWAPMVRSRSNAGDGASSTGRQAAQHGTRVRNTASTKYCTSKTVRGRAIWSSSIL